MPAQAFALTKIQPPRLRSTLIERPRAGAATRRGAGHGPPHLAQRARRLRQDDERSSRQAFTGRSVECAGRHRLLLLDDMHRITDPAMFEFFDALVERLPAHWGVVMASRTDPPLPLPKLRAHGDCVELRQDDLGCNADDVCALMQLRQVDATDEAVRAVHERTQGSPAGLGLVLNDSAQPADRQPARPPCVRLPRKRSAR